MIDKVYSKLSEMIEKTKRDYKALEVGFRITGRKGFQITFENGNTISVQFGPGNYCEHYDANIMDFLKENNEIHKSKDAEVAAWNREGTWYNFREKKFIECSDPIGHVSPDELAEIIKQLSAPSAL